MQHDHPVNPFSMCVHSGKETSAITVVFQLGIIWIDFRMFVRRGVIAG